MGPGKYQSWASVWRKYEGGETEEARARVVSMGEEPWRACAAGLPGVGVQGGLLVGSVRERGVGRGPICETSRPRIPEEFPRALLIASLVVQTCIPSKETQSEHRAAPISTSKFSILSTMLFLDPVA